MPQQKLSANTWTTLAEPLTDTSTILVVTTTDPLPTLTATDSYFFLDLLDLTGGAFETVRVVAVAGTELTVERGQGGTSARSYGAGTSCGLRVNKAVLDHLGDLPLQAPAAFTQYLQNCTTLNDVLVALDAISTSLQPALPSFAKLLAGITTLGSALATLDTHTHADRDLDLAYDLSSYAGNFVNINAGDVVVSFLLARATTITPSLSLVTASSGTGQLSIRKNGVEFATITVTAGGQATLTGTTTVTNRGDLIDVVLIAQTELQHLSYCLHTQLLNKTAVYDLFAYVSTFDSTSTPAGTILASFCLTRAILVSPTASIVWAATGTGNLAIKKNGVALATMAITATKTVLAASGSDFEAAVADIIDIVLVDQTNLSQLRFNLFAHLQDY